MTTLLAIVFSALMSAGPLLLLSLMAPPEGCRNVGTGLDRFLQSRRVVSSSTRSEASGARRHSAGYTLDRPCINVDPVIGRLNSTGCVIRSLQRLRLTRKQQSKSNT
jgi:hypothetical protein